MRIVAKGESMKKIKLGQSNQEIPALAVGCMRINALTPAEIEAYILRCLELGANFFDHADIYGGGECEALFGGFFKHHPTLREKMFLQSKAGIVPGKMYDASKTHIIQSVEASLKRLQTEYLDLFLLHRPDALIEPEEVAQAFEHLYQTGKVRHFGVSNQNVMQIRLLQKYVQQPLLVNQLQFSAPVATMITQGMEVNMMTEGAIDRDGGILDYCRLKEITIQAWSPFQQPEWRGTFLESDAYPELNQVLEEVGESHQATKAMIAAAWILRHPAHMQVIVGTTKMQRLEELVKATTLQLSREEWYRIYTAAGHLLP